MSRSIVIISTNKELLTEFYEKLLAEGFDTKLELSLSIYEPRNNIYIDPLSDLSYDDGFETSDIELYRSQLDDFTSPLIGYYVAYHGDDFLKVVLLSVANRSDIVVDDDNGPAMRGNDFVKIFPRST